MTTKAVILAGGLGKRMRKADGAGAPLAADAARMADRGLKGLIPIRGRPFLDYVIGSLLASGLRDLCLVVPPDCDELTEYVRRTSDRTGAAIRCAVQAEPRGTADALLAASAFAGAEPFVMCNCDNLYPAEALAQVAALSDRCCCVVGFEREALLRGGNFGADRIGRFAVMVVGKGNALAEIVEKPAEPERYVRAGKLWLNMNLYRFTPEVFDACRRIKPHPERGELELTDAVSLLVAEGRVPFRVLFSAGAVVDLTGRGDIAAAERLIGECPLP